MADNPRTDHSEHARPHNEEKSDAVNPKKRKRSNNDDNQDKKLVTSMGQWFFDKKSRKKKYLSLSGKIFVGQEAVRMARKDQFSPSHPSQILRGILIKNMKECSPSILVDRNILTNLNAWGLPEKLTEDYLRLAKISGLFKWQVDCLLSGEGEVWKGRKNLIYSAPTSGGKTLVAELLMLKNMAATMVLGDPKTIVRRTVMFVVPFLALAEEKANYFRTTWQSLNLSIKTFHSEDAGVNNLLTEDVEVAICTIERANILFNQLIAEQKEEQLSMIVIDEIHLLPDKNRGFLLEVLLTKVKYLLGSKVQIIGMSATLPNISELANWLDAELYTTSYRPVELMVMVCMENKLFEAVTIDERIQSFPQSSKPLSQINSNIDKENTVKDSNKVTPRLDPLCPLKAIDSDSFFQLNEFDYFLPSQPTTSSDLFPDSSGQPLNVMIDEDTNSSIPLDLLRATASTTLSGQETTNSGFSLDECQENEKPKKRVEYKLIKEVESTQRILNDEDGFKTLCLESIDQKKNILVFCNSKKRCENCALSLVDTLVKRNQSPMSNHPSAHPDQQLSSTITIIRSGSHQLNPSKEKNYPTSSLFFSIDEQLLSQRQEILDSLRLTNAGLSSLLQQTLPHGIAYHHAGLTQEERNILENGFRKGVIQVLCTTSTLAAGVNLPAHRVIIRSLQMGDSLLSVASFRQMCGRAGRLGYFQPTDHPQSRTESGHANQPKGEAILLLGKRPSTANRDHCEHVLCGELDPLQSALVFGAGGGMEKLLLEMIAANRLTREQDVMKFVSCSFMTTQCHYSSNQIQEFVESALFFLKRHQFLQHLSGRLLVASPLGRATTTSGLSPMDAASILPELLRARHKLSLLANDFHLIYLTTPLGSVTHMNDPPRQGSTTTTTTTNSSTSAAAGRLSSTHTSHRGAAVSNSGALLEPDWKILEQVVDKAYKDFPELRTVAEEYLGIESSLLCSFAFCGPPAYHSERYRLYKRFYNALLLFSQLQDRPMMHFSRFLFQSGGDDIHYQQQQQQQPQQSSSQRKISRGSLQQLQRDAATFASMLLVFCKNLNYHALAAAFEEIQRRYIYGTSNASQLQNLLQLREMVLEMTPLRAKAFYIAGMTTLEEVIAAGKDTVSDILFKSMPYTSSKAVDITIQYDAISNTSNPPQLLTLADKEKILCDKLAEKIVTSARTILQRRKYL